MADTSTLQLPWRPTPARRPSSAKFGHVTRAEHGPGKSSKCRPGSAPLRPSYEPPASKGVVRRERGSTDELGGDAAVDVDASWPQSFAVAVDGESIPTMGSAHSEHARFLGKSAHRRERLAAIMDAVESEYHERRSARQVALAKREGVEWARTCRHYVHGSHADHGQLGKDRGPPPHSRSPGPSRRRPWSASSADRSQSVLNLGPPPSTSWDLHSHDRNASTTAADPVMQAIEARRQRSESWGLSKAVDNGIAVPKFNGAGWTYLSTSDDDVVDRASDIPSRNAAEAEWFAWIKRTIELREAPLVQVEKMYGRVEEARCERNSAIHAVAKGGRQRRENGNYVGRCADSSTTPVASDDSITSLGIRGRFTNQSWEDPVDPVTVPEMPGPQTPSRGHQLRGMGAQMIYIDRSMAELLLDICDVPSIRKAASMAIRAGSVVDTSKLKAKSSQSPSSSAMRRPAHRSALEGESRSRTLQTADAASTSEPLTRVFDSSDATTTGCQGDGKTSPQNSHSVVPRLDLTVLRTAGKAHTDKSQKAAQELEVLCEERREPQSVQVSQCVQQQVVRDALAQAQAAGTRSAASTAAAQKQKRASGQSNPARPAARTKGRLVSPDKRGQQHGAFVVSCSAMRLRQQATVARKISQLWGAGRGLPLQAKKSLQYA